MGGRWTGWAAVGLSAAAWGLWTAGLVGRGLVAGHWPMSTRYEFGLAFVWAMLGLHLLATAGIPRAGGAGLLLALALATWALTHPAGERIAAPLLPVLRSVWFPLHTLSAALAYGLFGVAAGLGLSGLAEREGTGQAALGHGARHRLGLPLADLQHAPGRPLGPLRLGPLLGLGP